MKSILFFTLLFVCSGIKAQQIPDKGKSSVPKDSTVYNGDEMVFTKVEIESEFPGGLTAWAKFLQHNLEYPNKAVRKNVQGMVVVQFIVDDKGKLSQIEAISGPELLRKAAEDVINKSPKWIPAIDKGVKVKSYKKQPIVFRLS